VLSLFTVFVLGPVWLDFKLNREADRFGTPAGMHRTARVTHGDWWCVITCDGRRIEMTFAARADTACSTLRRHLKARGYATEPYDPALWTPPGDALCSFRAPARRVRHGAEVRAFVRPSEGGVRVEVSVTANNG
jgi:hypothetical protein